MLAPLVNALVSVPAARPGDLSSVPETRDRRRDLTPAGCSTLFSDLCTNKWKNVNREKG